tara:strand:- start:364 stop:1833 length:1470 start_codon:yes stop_codon:yes gene_type:complete
MAINESEIYNDLIGIFGQNTQPTTDPTFTSGLNYAQSIAGGQNVPNMIAPGVSYSAANPQGFTQSGINTPVAPTIPIPPDDSAFLPGGSAINPPDYINLPPNIVGGGMGDNVNILPPNDFRFPPPVDILGNNGFTPPSQNQTPTYEPLDLSGVQSILDMLKPEPIDYDRIANSIDLPDFNNFAMKSDLAAFDPANFRNDFISIARDEINNIPTFDDTELRDLIGRNSNQINNIPTFDPSSINNQISGLQDQIGNIPQFDPSTLNLPDFNDFATRDDLANIPSYDDSSLRDMINNIQPYEPIQINPMPQPVDVPVEPMQDFFVPDVPVTSLQDTPTTPVGMGFIPDVDVPSPQEQLNNLIDMKDILQEIPAEDGVRNQYQVAIDDFINESPDNMDAYTNELPIGSAINLGIPAVMEKVVPAVVPGLGLAQNISNALQNDYTLKSEPRPILKNDFTLKSDPTPAPQPARKPSIKPAFTPGIDYSNIYKFGR